MVACSAFGCTNRLRKGCGISFFKFPHDVPRRKIWEYFSRGDGFSASKHHALCSEHFSMDMFDYHPKKFVDLGLAFSKRPALKDSAIPDIRIKCGIKSTWSPPSDVIRAAYAKEQETETEAMNSPVTSADWQSDSSLPTCLEYLFNIKLGSDVRFVVGDSQDVVMGHRSILICRSSVLCDLLMSHQPDPVLHQWVVRVTDTSKNIFNILLRYLYTDKVDESEMTERVAKELIVLAKQYRVNRLVSHCEGFLKERKHGESRKSIGEHLGNDINDETQPPIGSVLQSSDNNMYLVPNTQKTCNLNWKNNSLTAQERTDQESSNTCLRDTNVRKFIKTEVLDDGFDNSENTSQNLLENLRDKYYNSEDSVHQNVTFEKSFNDSSCEMNKETELGTIKEEVIDESSHSYAVSQDLGVVLENLEDGSYTYPASMLPKHNKAQHIREGLAEVTMETETLMEHNNTASNTVVTDYRNDSPESGSETLMMEVHDEESDTETVGQSVQQEQDSSFEKDHPLPSPTPIEGSEPMETDGRRTIKRINQIGSDDEISYVDDQEEDPNFMLSDSDTDGYDDDSDDDDIESDDDEDWMMGKSEKVRGKNSYYIPNERQSDNRTNEKENLNVFKPASRKKINPQDCSYDVSYPAIFTKKYLKNANQGNSKSGRLYDRLHACPFCKKLFSHVQTHMEHKHRGELEVNVILDLKKKIRKADKSNKASLYVKKKKLQKLLRNKGDNMHNQSVWTLKEGEILLSRRKSGCAFNVQDYGPCPDCEQWFVLDNIARHHLVCPGSNDPESTYDKPKGFSVIQTNIVKGKIVAGSRRLREEVFPCMVKDEMTEVAQNDNLITTLGDVWFLKHIDNKKQRKHTSSFRMRLSAKLLILLRKETGIAGTMSDFLCAQHFDNIVKCSIQSCQDEYHTNFKNPSTAVKLGYDLNRLASAKMGYAIKEKRESDQQEAADFLTLLQVDWSVKVTNLTSTIRNRKEFFMKNEWPDPADIRKLVQFLVQKLNNIDLSNIDTSVFREAVVLTQARLILYNRCPPDKLQCLRVEHCLMRSAAVSDVKDSLRQSLTVIEQVLVKSRDLIQVQDDAGKSVPIVIPKEVNKILEVLADGECRKKAGIEENNTNLFAFRGETVLSSEECLTDVKTRPEVGLKHPERILVDNLHLQISTLVQALSLDENEVQCICNQISELGKLHDQYYVQISGLISRIDIAKLMLIQELNLVKKFSNRKISDIQLNELEEEVGENTAEVQPESPGNEDDGICDDIVVEIVGDDGTDSTLGSPSTKVKRVRWTKFEEEEIMKYFAEYFSHTAKKTCPGQKDCRKAIELSRKQGGIIHLRTWETVKKKVSNMLHRAEKKVSETQGLEENVEISTVIKHQSHQDEYDDICHTIVEEDDDGDDKHNFCEKPKKGNRVRWTKSEIGEIYRYFSMYFNGEIKKTCPSCVDCRNAIASSKREGGRIHLRKWETIKKKVANMLISARKENS